MEGDIDIQTRYTVVTAVVCVPDNSKQWRAISQVDALPSVQAAGPGSLTNRHSWRQPANCCQIKSRAYQVSTSAGQ
jgi:hypothetical protein